MFTVAATLIISSCELDPNPEDENVEVQILNTDGFCPVSIDWDELNSSIGSYPITAPDANGFCYLKTAVTPYNLNMIQSYRPFTYKSLSIQNPKIVSFFDFAGYPTYLHVTVKFPSIGIGKYGRIQFLSTEMFTCENNELLTEGNSITSLHMLIPKNKTSISGKLALIEYLEDPSGYTDYTNWGFKNVNFSFGTSPEVIFTPDDLIFNPPESNVNVDISYPTGQEITTAYVYLRFPGYNKNSDMLIDKISSCGEHLNKVVPALLNIPFSIKVKSSYRKFYGGNLFNLDKFKSIILQPGTSGNIVNREIIQQTPHDDETDVSMNSSLSVKEEGEKGIYLYYVGGIITVTSSSSLKLSDIDFRGLKLKHGTFYSWTVIKLSSFNSIDEFTSSPYILQENFNSIEYSDWRYFTTAP